MKFYYNNVLLRTSKTHDYNFASIKVHQMEDGESYGVLKCSATYEGAMQEITNGVNRHLQAIENYERSIQAFNEGKTKIRLKDGRYSYVVELNEEKIEAYKKCLIKTKESLEDWNKTTKVVELEKR